MNIRKFDKWDDMIEEYNKNINATNQQLQDLNSQKQATLDNYNANYNNQLNEYNNLMSQQEANINTYKETQEELLDKQLARTNEKIDQNKKETQEQINEEKKDAYVDYMKQINQYGGAQEQLASQGLATTGYAESSKIAMYNTYQNRVSAANTALTKANVEYDNQMQDAVLNNDVQKAQLALDTLQKKYELALKGFEYKNALFNNKTNFELSVEDNYFNKANTVQNRIDNYRTQINNINEYREKMAEEKRQFNQSLAAAKSSSGSAVIDYDDTTDNQQNNTKLDTTIGNKSTPYTVTNSKDKITPYQSSPDKTINVKKDKILKLSNNNANNYFNYFLNQYNGKKVKISDIEGLLNTGLNNKIINESDYKKIANYFGLDAE